MQIIIDILRLISIICIKYPREVNVPKYRIREIAEEKGWNMTRLAREANIERATITPLWKGEDANPRMSTLEAIARKLDVEVGDLLGEGLAGKIEDGLARTSR
jgi:DNA-binding Xre family transcriptional regulator